MNFMDVNNFKDLLGIFWKYKTRLLSLTTSITILSIALSYLIPNQYTSTGLYEIRQVDQSQPDLSGLGGYASLAGLDLPGGGSSKDAEHVVEILKSKIILKNLLTIEGYRENLVAAKKYDFGSGELSYKNNLYDPQKKVWKRKQKNNIGSIPSYVEVHQNVAYKKLKISRDKATNFIEISFEHPSPYFAKDFIETIVTTTNSKIKEDDLSDATKALTYLKEELDKVEFEEIRMSISKLIEENINIIMLANIYDDYSLVAIEPPFIPEKKSSPSRILALMMSFLIGIAISIISVFYSEYKRYIYQLNEH